MARKKMDQEVKAKWLKALRGGRYKQGQFKLKRNDSSYCCLGLLCNVVGNGKWKDSTGYENVKMYVIKDVPVNDLAHSNYPPDQVLAQAGVTKSTAIQLSELNDSGKDFKEIADWIDKYL